MHILLALLAPFIVLYLIGALVRGVMRGDAVALQALYWIFIYGVAFAILVGIAIYSAMHPH